MFVVGGVCYHDNSKLRASSITVVQMELSPMYATDRRQTKASLNASALWVQRHNNVQRINNKYSMVFRSGNYTIPVKAGTLSVPFRGISYSCKIRNEAQIVPFRRYGNYNPRHATFCSVNYHILVESRTQSFRSIPEIITTRTERNDCVSFRILLEYDNLWNGMAERTVIGRN